MTSAEVAKAGGKTPFPEVDPEFVPYQQFLGTLCPTLVVAHPACRIARARPSFRFHSSRR